MSRIHNEYYDYDRYTGGDPPDPPPSYQAVMDFFCAENEEQCKRSIYKYTDCGAWIEFKPDGIVIGSIVEGCDFGTATYPLYYEDNFVTQDIHDRIRAVEHEAREIWDWMHVTRDKNGRPHRNGKTWADQGLDAPDTSNEYSHFNQGERSS